MITNNNSVLGAKEKKSYRPYKTADPKKFDPLVFNRTDIIENLKNHFMVKTDSELGVLLGKSQASISNARQKKIPWDFIVAALQSKKTSVDSLLFGDRNLITPQKKAILELMEPLCKNQRVMLEIGHFLIELSKKMEREENKY